MTSSAVGFLQAKHNDRLWTVFQGLNTLYTAIKWFFSAAASPTSVTTKSSLMTVNEEGQLESRSIKKGPRTRTWEPGVATRTGAERGFRIPIESASSL